MTYFRPIAMAMILMMTLGVSGIYAQEQPLPSSTLVVGTKDAAPFAMKTREGTWSGISIYLWRQIAADLHLTYEFRELDLKGLLDGVSNGSLDVAVAALSLTPEREKTFDFTHPYYITGLGIAVASKQRSPWLAVLRRFLSHSFLKVVAVLALLLLVVGGIVWWFERKRNPKEFGGSAAKGVGSGFWWSAVTMTAVGYGDKVPVTLGGRIAATIWMFASVVIISSFIAAVTSALTVSQLESPVQGPTDLPKVRVGAVANTTGESYLQDNQISFRTYRTALEGLSAIADGNIDALVYDEPLLRYFVNQNFHVTLEVLPATFVRQDYGIALPEGSPLREPINRVLLQKIREPAWQDTLYRYMGR